VLFAISVIAANRSTLSLGANTANFGRVLVAVVLLGAWAYGFGLGLGGGGFGWFFVSGVIGFGLGDMALFHSLPRLGPRLSSLMINCLAAPFGTVIEWFWLDTRLSVLQILGGLTILAGVGLALAPERAGSVPRPRRASGILFGIGAGLGQGLGAVLSRKAYAVAASAGHAVDGGTAAFQRILGGLLVVAMPFLWSYLRQRARSRGDLSANRHLGTPGLSGRTAVPASPCRENPAFRARAGSWYQCVTSCLASRLALNAPQRRAAWLWVALNGLAGPTVGVGLYQWALRSTPSGIVLPIMATTPLVVIPFTFYLEGDRPGARSLFGGLLAVLGVIGLSLGPLR